MLLASNATPRPQAHSAFTLIELLVVIAVIALLLGLLVPTFAKARKLGQLSVSLSNLRQISIGAAGYAIDEQSWPSRPLDKTWDRYWYNESLGPFNRLESHVAYMWGFGGKSATGRDAILEPSWRSLAKNRLINPYMVDHPINEPQSEPQTLLPVPNSPSVTPDDGARLEIEQFRCPGDNGSPYAPEAIERPESGWPDGGLPAWTGRRDTSITSYDHVGTSYIPNFNHIEDFFEHENVRTTLNNSTLFKPAVDYANELIANGVGTAPSRFVWVGEPSVHFVSVWKANTPGVRIESNFGDLNKGAAGFADGSARYLDLKPRKIDPDTGKNLGRFGDRWVLGLDNPGIKRNSWRGIAYGSK